jgi:hypothetical protein
MDKEIKQSLNQYFTTHFSEVYNTKPELHAVEGTNYYYITNSDSNVICLMALEMAVGTMI